MYSPHINLFQKGICGWFLKPFALANLTIDGVSFSDASKLVGVYYKGKLSAKGRFETPSLVTPFAVHLTLCCDDQKIAKGWISRQALNEADFRRLSRWIISQRKQYSA